MLIGQWLESHPIGELFYAPFDVVFSEFDVVEPDLLYLSNAKKAASLTDKHALGADLVIEIASPGTRKRDVGIKLELYERAGVLEYWFVDADAGSIDVHRRAGEQFAPALHLSSDPHESLSTPLLPGLQISVASLLRE
jgi:Uma2 family endonuclease